ncbi:MAG TPA: ATP-dependent helicase [Casimicrobiaceae bacterium]|nr:ATP-dependent helicase [Casimicrobiaceae bacterium]
MLSFERMFDCALNPAQWAAVHHGEGQEPAAPLLVIAGAGSGKTSTLAHRVARLVHGGADPQRILLLTFSRRAAQELERRAMRVLAKSLALNRSAPPHLPWAGTFHGIGARLLREYAERVGLAPTFTIHDRSDAEDLMALVRQTLAIDATAKRFPGAATCVAIYSRTVNAECPLDEVLDATFPWCATWKAELRTLFRAYVEAKQAQHVLDYDDLLLYWAAMLQEPDLAAECGARFDHILIDEYQDTNRLQATILRAMKPDGAGVTVVGDDAQAIYSFRAATVRNILDFPAQFAPPAKVIALESNYRSTGEILDASNAVIALASERYTKELRSERGSGARPRLISVRDEAEQASCLAEQVLAWRELGIDLRRQAVLFRTSSHSALLELELARRSIPFVKFGGLKFLEAAHIKDVLSLLRWAENPRGRVAGFRAARLVAGVGPATATRLLDGMHAAPNPHAARRAHPMPPGNAEWSRLLDVYDVLANGAAGWPGELDAVLAWYEPQMARIYDDAAPREADLDQLRSIASTYPSRERFLTELTLDPPSAVSNEADGARLDDDYLILSTIHSAKGQEWTCVQIMNVVDGCIPSDLATRTTAELEEERRLLYVGMTRAKDQLTLLVPQRFHVKQQAALGDQHVYASRSRFIPASIARHFDILSWPAARGDATGSNSSPRSRIDILQKGRSAW